MRIVAMSDCHNRISPIEKAIEKSNPDVFIYCGDGSAKVEDISYLYPNIRFFIVKGNCDFGEFPIEVEVKLASKTVFFTHGHIYSVKSGYGKIIAEGKRRNADIVIFGHTHIAVNEYIDGMYLVNPGSAALPAVGKPGYAFIEISDKGICINSVEL